MRSMSFSVPKAAAHGADQRPQTYAADSAHALHRYLKATRRTERAEATGARVAPLTSVARIRQAPAHLRVALAPKSLSAKRGGKDTDGLVTFWTGSRLSAACLDLKTGAVTASPCHQQGAASQSAAADLGQMYRQFIRAAIWFDRHPQALGLTVRDTALIEHLRAHEFPAWLDASYADTDGDAIVDDGEVVLTLADHGAGAEGCGVVSLPEPSKAGTHYNASMRGC